MSSNIIAYLLLYQVFPHAYVLVLCDQSFGKYSRGKNSLHLFQMQTRQAFFQILLKIERTAVILSKISRS